MGECAELIRASVGGERAKHCIAVRAGKLDCRCCRVDERVSRNETEDSKLTIIRNDAMQQRAEIVRIVSRRLSSQTQRGHSSLHQRNKLVRVRLKPCVQTSTLIQTTLQTRSP